MPNDCMPKDIMPEDRMPNDFMPFYCPALFLQAQKIALFENLFKYPSCQSLRSKTNCRFSPHRSQKGCAYNSKILGPSNYAIKQHLNCLLALILRGAATNREWSLLSRIQYMQITISDFMSVCPSARSCVTLQDFKSYHKKSQINILWYVFLVTLRLLGFMRQGKAKLR